MKEEQLFDPMIAYLEKEGYSILEQHRGHEHGTDIVATKSFLKISTSIKMTCREIGQFFRLFL